MKTPPTTSHHELLANGTPADPYHPFYNDIFKSDVAEAAASSGSSSPTGATAGTSAAAPSAPLLKIPFADVSYAARLHWGPDELSRWARDMAVACANAHRPLHDAVFDITMIGDTPEEAYLRASDPSAWRRKGARVLRIAQEVEELKKGQIGSDADYQYSGAKAQQWSAHKKKATADYLQKTVVCGPLGQKIEKLSDLVRTPAMVAARSYALLKAMEHLAKEQNLRWAMLTITLPAKWHPNPQNKSKGKKSKAATKEAGKAGNKATSKATRKAASPQTSPPKAPAKKSKLAHQWNQRSADEAHSHIQDGWSLMRSALRKHGIMLTGVRTEEPQKDSTPHWHCVFFFRDDDDLKRISAATLQQFPAGLRVRHSWATKASKLQFSAVQYQTLADFKQGKSHKNLRRAAQCQIDVGAEKTGDPAIDKKISGLANYALKYVTKAYGIKASDLRAQVGAAPKKGEGAQTPENPAPPDDAQDAQDAQDELASTEDKTSIFESGPAAAVRRHRETYGIRGITFFGIPKGLITCWDLLRQVRISDAQKKSCKLLRSHLNYLASICQQEKGTGFVEYLRLCGGLALSPLERIYLVSPMTTQVPTRHRKMRSDIIGVEVINLGKCKYERRLLKGQGRQVMLGIAAKGLVEAAKNCEFDRINVVFDGRGESAPASETQSGSAALVHIGLTVTFTPPAQETPSENSPFVAVLPPPKPEAPAGHSLAALAALAASNASQQTAIRVPVDGNYTVLAAAGSGKTHVLVERVRFLISSGVEPESIVLATFTREAALNMAARLGALGLSDVQVGTMHSLSGRWLAHTTTWFSRQNVTSRGTRSLYPATRRLRPAQNSRAKAKARAKATASARYALSEHLLLRSAYQAKKAQRLGIAQPGQGQQNFDAIIRQSTQSGVQDKYLLVDEAQDLSPEQWEWVRAHAKHTFVVGDLRQAIYGWRGAKKAGLLEWAQLTGAAQANLFEQDTLVELPYNRRSGAAIVALGNALACAATPAIAVKSEGEVLSLYVQNAVAEVTQIAQWLSSAHGSKAVLARTNAEVAYLKAELFLRDLDIPVLTIHEAKGQEWDSVVLACGKRKPSESSEEASETWYVAVTRAIRSLLITSQGALPTVLKKAVAKIQWPKPEPEPEPEPSSEPEQPPEEELDAQDAQDGLEDEPGEFDDYGESDAAGEPGTP